MTIPGSTEATAHPPRVLLWARMTSHFREMFRIARVLSRAGQFEPVMFFEYPYVGHEEAQALCEHEGIRWILQLSRRFITSPPAVARPAFASSPPAPGRAKRGLLRRCVRGFQYLYCRYLAGYVIATRARILPGWTAMRSQRRQLRRCRELLDRAAPAVLVFPEDNIEFATAALIKVGHERSIPAVVVPYTISNAAEPGESYFASHPHQANSRRNRSAAAEFPRWVYRHHGRDLIRLPAPELRAKERFGLAPPQPWVFNSGAADAIVVESPALKDYYVRAGLPPQQVRVLGSIRLDEVAAHHRHASAERRRLLERLGWAEPDCLILTAVPPNQRPWTRPGCEFATYEDLMAFWVRALADVPGGRVLVNPHPRGDARALYGLERDNVRVVAEDLARLIPLCDLYVASVSATIPMALACGKPVVNYDVYHYGYDDFAASSLVHTVRDRSGYVAALQGWREIARQGGAGSPQLYWGTLDGLSGARLVRLVDELLPAAARTPLARKAS
jgi:hypothetical protein